MQLDLVQIEGEVGGVEGNWLEIRLISDQLYSPLLLLNPIDH